MNLNGKIEMANAIVQSWAPDYYDTLKHSLMLGDIFKSDYEGIIKKRGDTVKVNVMNLEEAETLTNDKTKFNSTKIGLTQYELKINRQTVHAVDITDLADLQSESYMEKLKTEMGFKIMSKMEKEIKAGLIASIPVGNIFNPANAGKMAKADLVEARKRMGKKLIGPNRFSIQSVDYYSDLISDSVLSSTDFIEGHTLTSQKLPNVLGFKHVEHNLLSDKTGIFADPSGFHVAIQRGMNLQVTSKLANNELAFMVVADIVWDYKAFDTERLFMIKEA